VGKKERSGRDKIEVRGAGRVDMGDEKEEEKLRAETSTYPINETRLNTWKRGFQS